MRRVLSTMAVLAIGGLTLAGCSDAPAAASVRPAAAAGGSDNAGIVARGVGRVTGTPDTVTVELGVQTQGPSAKAALDANTAKANGLIDMLKGKGIAEKDLRTSQLNVNPTYGPDGGRITGYQVTNLVTATLHDITGAGAIIDAAGESAGDAVRVQQLSFSIADDSALRAQARTDAVKQAQAQAKQMADAAGVGLGKVRTISEVPVSTPMPYAASADLKAASGAPAPVLPGSQELQVLVDVVYDIG
ncbi:SIMPL domain-containing protein [Pseudonocardia sp. GCM10023141]|uniref:SIMPL domain-containing protein n=1 Tax=Pseudonocardia sp. GCM10023141 TaxID=3252653 RepID=UPI003615813F